MVAARDRARPPSAADRPRLRAQRLEPGLDELHPGPGASGLAADCGLRAGAGLRRARAGCAGAGRLVHVPPLPRPRDGHAGRAGRRPGLRLRHLRSRRDAQPPQSRTRVHPPARRTRREPLPARLALGSPLRRALRALRRRRVRDVPGDALLGDAGRGRRARPGYRVRARERARRGSSAASRSRPSRMPSRSSCSALPVGRAGPSRSAWHQRPWLRARPRQSDRPDARDGSAPVVAPSPRRATRRQQPHRAARLRRSGAPGDRRFRALGAAASATRARACDHDRRRDRARARLAPRRGRSPHLARCCRGRSSTACRSRAMRCLSGPSCSCGLRWPW